MLPSRIFLTALLCELILVAIYWLDILTGGTFQLLHALFDLDSEGNIPAWFSSSQLFAVAITFFSCALRKGTERRPSRVFFILAGVAALYVSSDETAQIHERVTAVIGARYIDWVPPFAAKNFFFVMILVAVLVSVGQMLADDLFKLWIHYPRVFLLIILGVSIGLAGGMVVETLGYKFLDSNSIWYRAEVTAEEFMEMWAQVLSFWRHCNSDVESAIVYLGLQLKCNPNKLMPSQSIKLYRDDRKSLRRNYLRRDDAVI